jgi:hypothetical protein
MMPFLKGIHDGQKLFDMNIVINFDKRKLTRIETKWMKKIIFFGLWEYDT